jgi:hypothetical protein
MAKRDGREWNPDASQAESMHYKLCRKRLWWDGECLGDGEDGEGAVHLRTETPPLPQRGVQSQHLHRQHFDLDCLW